jgi:hypothetical protein
LLLPVLLLGGGEEGQEGVRPIVSGEGGHRSVVERQRSRSGLGETAANGQRAKQEQTLWYRKVRYTSSTRCWQQRGAGGA